MFNDWNHNGKRDAFDSFVDYNLANGKKSRTGSSGASVSGIIKAVIVIALLIAYIVNRCDVILHE